VALYQRPLPRLSTSLTGAGGSPQLTGRPSQHAVSPTPERFRAAPESIARTSAFAQIDQARPALSLTGHISTRQSSRSLRPAALRLLASTPDSAERRRLATGLLWRPARVGLTPTGRSALHWARSNPCGRRHPASYGSVWQICTRNQATLRRDRGIRPARDCNSEVGHAAP
jgi:hypothetical protein